MRNINRQLVTSCQRLRTKAVAKVLHFSTENGIVIYFFVVFGQVLLRFSLPVGCFRHSRDCRNGGKERQVEAIQSRM